MTLYNHIKEPYGRWKPIIPYDVSRIEKEKYVYNDNNIFLFESLVNCDFFVTSSEHLINHDLSGHTLIVVNSNKPSLHIPLNYFSLLNKFDYDNRKKAHIKMYIVFNSKNEFSKWKLKV